MLASTHTVTFLPPPGRREVGSLLERPHSKILMNKLGGLMSSAVLCHSLSIAGFLLPQQFLAVFTLKIMPDLPIASRVGLWSLLPALRHLKMSAGQSSQQEAYGFLFGQSVLC